MVNTILNGTNVLKAQKQILVVKPSIENNTCKLRVAAYARVSSNSEDQLNSFSAQVRYYRQTIEEDEQNILVDIYSDEGITGTSIEKRDDFNRLLEDCRQGKIDRIITKSISRFARNTLDSISTVRELRSLGISVYFEKENMDTGLMSGETLLTLYSAVAQQESKSISENCKMSIRFRMGNGTYVSSNPPYGYRLVNKELEIYEPEAQIVKMIFADYLNGMGANAIAKKLDKLGVKNKAGTVKWRYQTINDMLKNASVIISIT